MDTVVLLVFEVVGQRMLIFTFSTEIPFRKPTFCSAIIELMVPGVLDGQQQQE